MKLQYQSHFAINSQALTRKHDYNLRCQYDINNNNLAISL